MFIGHYGPAVWDTQRGHGKPLIKLWEGFLAVQFVDIICGILIMLGIEGTRLNAAGEPVFNIPWSHSLISTIFFAILAAGLYRLFRPKASGKALVVIAGLVFSHWIFDLIVHRPDLPPYPGSQALLGFGLWDLPWIAFALEAGLLAAAFAFWQKVTTAKNKKYDYAIWILFVVMVSIHYAVIVHQGIQVQNGTYDHSAQPPTTALGASMVFAFALFAFLISRIERGRPSKFEPETS